MKSNISIRTFNRDGITYLKESFASMPFKIMDVREDKTNPCLELMMMSSSPGILDGDDYTFEILINENDALSICTQSYQRLFQMKSSATQKMKVQVGKNASFNYFPHPTVPHKQSNFSACNDIYLAQGAQLIWSDIFSCGRKLNGEAFEYTSFENRTTIYKKNQPVIIEHLLFRPQSDLLTGIGQLENFSHTASLFIIDEHVSVKVLKQKVDEILRPFTTIEFGTSEAAINGLIVKILANGADQLHNLIGTIIHQVKNELNL